MSDIKVSYLCDRTACLGCSIEPSLSCSHTTDIRHAVNFGKLNDKSYMEKERDMDEAMTVEKDDPVNHPSHYCKPGQLECIEKMETAFGIESVKRFCLLNAFKYVERCQGKGNFKQDIEKAIWYLKRLASYIDDEHLETWIQVGSSSSIFIKVDAYAYAAELEMVRLRFGNGQELEHIGCAIGYLNKAKGE